MQKIVIVAMATLVLFGCASKRNPTNPYPIAAALAVPEYREKLAGIKLFFGNQSHPVVVASHGVHSTVRRSGLNNREVSYSCKRAFVSALLRLRGIAVKSGADAVINIKSNYKHREVSSESQYQCATGLLMSGVALKGQVVKLSK